MFNPLGLIRVYYCGMPRSTNSRAIALLGMETLLREAISVGAVEVENVFDVVTHVIVYPRKDQIILEKDILRR